VQSCNRSAASEWPEARTETAAKDPRAFAPANSVKFALLAAFSGNALAAPVYSYVGSLNRAEWLSATSPSSSDAEDQVRVMVAGNAKDIMPPTVIDPPSGTVADQEDPEPVRCR
jgi:hypothetical protein